MYIYLSEYFVFIKYEAKSYMNLDSLNTQIDHWKVYKLGSKIQLGTRQIVY